MTELDSEIGPLALELIDEFGKAIVYTRVDTLAYDPATSTAGVSETVLNVKAIIEEYNGQAFVAGLIERGDKKATVAAQAFAEFPTTGDRVEFDGVAYTVVSVKVTYSGELAALYELQLRQ